MEIIHNFHSDYFDCKGSFQIVVGCSDAPIRGLADYHPITDIEIHVIANNDNQLILLILIRQKCELISDNSTDDRCITSWLILLCNGLNTGGNKA